MPRSSCWHNRPTSDLKIDTLVTATGSAGTQAGLVAGLAMLNAQIPVLGIGVRAPKDRQEANVFALAEKTCAHVGVPGAVKREQVVANCDYVGQGYGIPTEGMVEAVKLLARTEGILLDPVYSGKAMAGLIDLIQKGHFKKDADGRLPAHGRRRGTFRLSQRVRVAGICGMRHRSYPEPIHINLECHPKTSTNRWQDMRDYKGTNLSDRLKNSKQAKQLLLQKASEAPKPDDPTLAAQRAAAQAKAIAREAERLQRIEAKAAAAREKAEQKAAAAAKLAEQE